MVEINFDLFSQTNLTASLSEIGDHDEVAEFLLSNFTGKAKQEFNRQVTIKYHVFFSAFHQENVLCVLIKEKSLVHIRL